MKNKVTKFFKIFACCTGKQIIYGEKRPCKIKFNFFTFPDLTIYLIYRHIKAAQADT